MRVLALAALVALAASSVAAERRQFGNVVYDLPPLWSQGRSDEYAGVVQRLKSERRAFLEDFPSLSEEIVAAVD